MKVTTTRALLALGFFMTLTAGSCDDPPSSDQVQQQQQETILQQGTNAVGMPAITNFAERKELKEILELRDNPGPTYTYVIDRDANLHFLCNSFGYPMPYSTQFTSPSKQVNRFGNAPDDGTEIINVLPQADPNGLFSPAEAAGTWVNCVNPTTGKASIVYSEPDVVASPYPLDTSTIATTTEKK